MALPGNGKIPRVFETGDRVRLAEAASGGALDPVGTVVAIIAHTFGDGSSVRDVLVRWDTGIEVAVAHERLAPAPSQN